MVLSSRASTRPMQKQGGQGCYSHTLANLAINGSPFMYLEFSEISPFMRLTLHPVGSHSASVH